MRKLVNQNGETKIAGDERGVSVYIDAEAFRELIVKNGNCFVCGADRKSKQFNDEHILPNWMLRKYKLANRSINLPNSSKFTYGKYKIPCCQECNSLLGKNLEEPISAALKRGISGVAELVEKGGIKILYQWLCLIFLKTHLKDTTLFTKLDRRSSNNLSIAESMDYDFGRFHHIFCVARCVYSGAELSDKAISSILVIEAKEDQHYEHFDFVDLSFANAFLLRCGNVCIIAVLDDACGAISLFQDELKKISGPCSPVQLREILAHVSFFNITLKERPTFFTKYGQERSEIVVTHPSEVAIVSGQEEVLHKLMSHLCSEFFPDNSEKAKNIELLKKGYYQFLLNRQGTFDSASMDLTSSDLPKEKIDRKK